MKLVWILGLCLMILNQHFTDVNCQVIDMLDIENDDLESPDSADGSDNDVRQFKILSMRDCGKLSEGGLLCWCLIFSILKSDQLMKIRY
jgi:hypothetical protein